MDELPTTTNPEADKPTTETTPAASAPTPSTPERHFRGGGQRGRGGFGGGGRGGFGGRGRGRSQRPTEKSEFDSKPLDIARVARVTKGGKRFSFRTTVVIGDGKGRVGLGMGKGRDVAQSIQKATNQAKKHLFTVPMVNGTIPYQVEYKYCSARVVLKPATGGVKAGGPVRVVAKLAGIKGLTGKLIERTGNKINIAMATLHALKLLRIAK